MSMSSAAPVVLAIGAHPDDIELLFAGTLRLLVESGWQLRCVTMTGGDLGASSGTREAIRARRLAEAERAAAVLGGTHAWAGFHDMHVFYNAETLAATVEQIRQAAPEIVITHSPECYAVDHEQTATIARAACFGSGVPLFATGGAPAMRAVPALYYSDAVEDRDQFGRPVVPSFFVDVTDIFARRQEALACHASQRDWLRDYHGDDEFLASNERAARRRGQACGARYAEGFRQHLGAAFPQENRLGDALRRHIRHHAAARSGHLDPVLPP
jgi:LmbE family N-acetylglucosaminyl deacetylase